VPALLVEMTWDWEAITAVRATRVVAVVAVETSAQEAATVWDSAALHVKDVEDRATLRGEGGTQEGIESGSRKCHSISLC
jgi:hypothetical protein